MEAPVQPFLSTPRTDSSRSAASPDTEGVPAPAFHSLARAANPSIPGPANSAPEVVAAVAANRGGADQRWGRQRYDDEPVPPYKEEGTTTMSEERKSLLGLPLTTSSFNTPTDPEIARIRSQLMEQFQRSVSEDNRDTVLAMIRGGLVSPDVFHYHAISGLGLAAQKGHLAMAKLLVSLGAEVDLVFYGQGQALPDPTRTALLLAAEAGNLAMVKYLMSVGADDAFIASDGQIALRLAADNKHREVVEFLPSRRGGAFLRWKTHHRRMLKQINSMLEIVYLLGYCVVWFIPKVFVWHLPKFILYDLPRASFEAAAKRFPAWYRRQAMRAREGFKYLKRVPKALGKSAARVAKATGQGAVKFGKWLPKAPAAIKNLVICGARFFVSLASHTVKWIIAVPKAVGDFLSPKFKAMATAAKKIGLFIVFKAPVMVKNYAVTAAIAWAKLAVLFSQWLTRGAAKIGRALGSLVAQILGALHTAILTAASYVSKLQNVTLKDLGNSLQVVGRALVNIPVTVWRVLNEIWDVPLKYVYRASSFVGVIIWCVMWSIWKVALAIPHLIVKILAKLGSSLGKGGHEVLVWFDPKRQ